MAAKKWFSMEQKADMAEVTIFDEIGGWGLTAKDFKAEFDRIRDSRLIKVSINSPGGSFIDGMAIYNMLSSVRSRVEVEVLGLAASIASVIALAGKKLTMAEGSYFMIHNPFTITSGDADGLRKLAEVLDKMQGNVADIYAEKTGQPREDIIELMNAETWFTAQEAYEHGFADESVDYGTIAARLPELDKFGFKNAPKVENTTEKNGKPTEREIERALHAAGCSKAEAKSIIATGFRSSRRDVGEEGRREAVDENARAEREKYIARKERERLALRRRI